MTRRTNSNYSTRLSQVRSTGAPKDHQFEEVGGYGTKRKNSSTIDLMEVDGRLRNGELLMDNSRKRYVFRTFNWILPQDFLSISTCMYLIHPVIVSIC